MGSQRRSRRLARVTPLLMLLAALAALALAACGDEGTTTAGGSPSPADLPSSGSGLVTPSEMPSPAPTPTVAGTIAFHSDFTGTGDTNISVVRTDGGGLHRVVKTPLLETTPAWSPDGRWIVYEVQEALGEFITLALAKADGSDARRLPLGKDGGTYPAWSPDGERLAYSSSWYPTDEHPPADVFVCDADGGHRRQLTEGPAYDLHAQWTPDGRAILFLRMTDAWDAPGDIYSVRPDGSGLTQVTNTGTIMEFALSPDGSRLAVDDIATRFIVLLPYGASGPPRTLLATDFDWAIVHISWSPDGTALVLGRSVEAEGDDDALVIVNADGSGLSAIPGVVGSEPEWRPE